MAVMICTMCILSSCNECTSEIKNDSSQFVTISDCGSFDIVYDTETKVEYAVSAGSYNYGTLTMIVNADGTPKLYEEN